MKQISNEIKTELLKIAERLATDSAPNDRVKLFTDAYKRASELFCSNQDALPSFGIVINDKVFDVNDIEAIKGAIKSGKLTL
jgi:anti-sigma28 factor (negative regulator of flagellin synthesis)